MEVLQLAAEIENTFCASQSLAHSIQTPRAKPTLFVKPAVLLSSCRDVKVSLSHLDEECKQTHCLLAR